MQAPIGEWLTFYPDGSKFPGIFRGVGRVAVMRQSVSRESPVPVDVDVLPDLLAILVLGDTERY